jgi:hypothetical protein
MIYMVDHIFADAALEPAWHEWYSGYLRKLVAVPGIHSAQRFRAIGETPSRFLAMYTIDSADVYTSDAYKSMGGGGSQSARFHPAYRLWTRNLFDAIPGAATPARAPAVRQGQRVLVFDRDRAPGGSTAATLESRATWLEAVGLHLTTKYRAFVVLDEGEGVMAPSLPGSFLYEPFTSVITT